MSRLANIMSRIASIASRIANRMSRIASLTNIAIRITKKTSEKIGLRWAFVIAYEVLWEQSFPLVAS